MGMAPRNGGVPDEGSRPVAGGPVATAAMETVFAADGAVWLPVYGPSDEKQTDAALSGVGLMRSDDVGQSWKF